MNLFNYPGLTPEQQAQLRNQALLQAGAGILAGTQGSYGRAAPAIGAGIQAGLSSANSQAMQMQQMNQTVQLLKQRKQDKKDKEAERKATEAFRNRQISYKEKALQETTRAAKAKEKYYPQRFSASTGGAGMGTGIGMGLGGYGMAGSIEDEVPPWMQGAQAAPAAGAPAAPTPEVPRGPQKPPMTSFLDMVSGQSSAPYRQQVAAPVAEQQPVQKGRYSPTQAKAFMASIERQIDRGDIKTREQAMEKWELLDMLRGVVPANELELLKARLPNI